MPVIAVIGAQWGDEGKGHIVDLLADQARLVIRYGGGDNAGHTVVNEYGEFNLHAVPSGIFDPATANVIGNGVVINPEVLINEIKHLEEKSISVAKLFISERAHVVMPYHLLEDQFAEHFRTDASPSRATQGIGPAYADKMARIGIRVGDLLHEETLLRRLRQVLDFKNRIITQLYKQPALSLHELYLRYLEYGHRLADHVIDTYPIISHALDKDLPILLEGADGAMLDIDHGSYPYVTLSTPGAAGACQGAGISPSQLNSVLGVYKAFTTHIGTGPFPTEIKGEPADTLRKLDMPHRQQQRIGWFDAVMGRYTAQINGINSIAITKLDLLDTLPKIKICTGYRMHDAELDYPPSNLTILERIEPIYEELNGWQTPTGDIREFDKLPTEAQAYVARICELIGAPLALISVGPKREQTITLRDLF